MKKTAAKAGLIFLEAVAILIAVFAAGAAFLYWRLEQGPVSLGILKPSVELAAERRLPAGYNCAFEKLELARDEKRGVYRVLLSGVRISDGAGVEAARAQRATLSFALGDMLAGKVGPQTVLAEGAAFRIVRNAAQSVEIPAAPRRREERPFPVLAPLIDGGILESAFDRAEMTEAHVVFLDAASGRSWTSNDARILIRRSADGLDADVSAQIDLDGAAASIRANATYTEESKIVTADIDGENFPIGDILSMFYGESAAIVDAPASGKAVISFTSEGDVLASHFTARIDKGRLNVGADGAPVEFIEWDAQFDPKKNEFDIERFAFDAGGSSGVLSGAVGIAFGDDARDPKTVSFDLSGEALTANLPGVFVEPLAFSRAAVAGAYHIDERKIDLDAIDLDLLDIKATGSFAMNFPAADDEGARPSPAVNADIRVDGALDPQRLLKLWPLGPAAGAREWVADRLAAAAIDNILAKVDLKEGAVGPDGRVPDEAVAVTFNARGVKAFYDKRMTPLTQGEGGGILRGNSFALTIDRARVGDIAISRGEVEFPVFVPKWELTYYRFVATGRSEAMLTVLDQEPLRVLSKINLQPEQFQGDAVADVVITRPNKRRVDTEEYGYEGTATFKNMLVQDIVQDLEFTGGTGDLELESRFVRVFARADLDDLPLDIVWRQNFFEEDGPSSFAVTGTIDASTLYGFGVGSRRFAIGPIALSAKATGDLGAFETLNLDADFRDTTLSVDALDWSKPAGVAAQGRMRLAFSPQGVAVEELDLAGDGLALTGDLAFRSDGALEAADIPQFYLEDAVDLALEAERKDAGSLAVTATGRYFNAGPLIERMLSGPGGGEGEEGFDWGPGLEATARIDLMELREGTEYRDVTLDFWRDAERLQALDFTALDLNGAPLRIATAETGEDAAPSQTVEARTSDVGALLRGVAGLTSIGGGDGIMRIDLGEPGSRTLSGEVEARNIKVTRAPLMARIFSAGSLDGLSNLLNNEGIDLTYAYGEFNLADSMLTVRNFRATGPSVGMTARGTVAMREGGEINVGGAVAPAYRLNSAFASAPIIGDLLVGKKGEGLVALSYAVNGARADPEVTVNPLSAVTPGILRAIMQPSQYRPGETGDEEAAENDQDPGTE